MGVCSVLGVVSRWGHVLHWMELWLIQPEGELLEEAREGGLADTLPRRHLPGRTGQGGQSEEAWPKETEIMV